MYNTKNPHGGDGALAGCRLDFSANVNPLGLPPAVAAAAREAIEAADRYPDPSCRALVEAIAEKENVPPSFILCGNGAAELIYAWCAAAGIRKAVELAPGFCEYSAALQLHGCKVERFVLSRERAFLPGKSLTAFLREQSPEAVVLCNPNNPTGREMPPELLEEIFSLCSETGIRLFLDECFLDLSDNRYTLASRLEAYPGLFLLRAFTKSYGMAGLRLGWCLSADRQLLSGIAVRTPPWNVSSVAQAAGLAALREKDFLERTRRLIQRERPRLREALMALGLWVCPSEANFLLFSGPAGLEVRLREHSGIAIRSCANFPGLGPGWYRVGVRKPEENQVLIAAIGEVL